METSSCTSTANSSSDLAKLFIGGINESLKQEEIEGYFAKFGEVKEVVVVKDRNSGSIRGFGFVEFADSAAAEKALNEKEHLIGERKVEVKRARPRGEQRMNYHTSPYPYVLSPHENRGLNNNAANNHYTSGNPMKLKKIFVGGLSSSITEDEFRGYFEKFGRITDVVIIYDSTTQRPRGFGFITFDSAEAVDNVLQKKFHELNNKHVEVKVAVPKDSNNQSNYSDSNCGSYNFSTGGGRGPFIGNYQGGFCPQFSPRYPGYMPPVPGFYYGTGGYGGGYAAPYNYGFPFPSARIPWSGPGMVPARRGPVPYGNAAMYGYHINTGYGNYAGMAGGYRSYMWSGDDKSNQTGSDVRITEEAAKTEEVGNEKLDAQQES